VQARFHGADRDTERCRRLGVSQPGQVEEENGNTLTGRQRHHRLPHAPGQLGLFRTLLRARAGVRDVVAEMTFGIITPRKRLEDMKELREIAIDEMAENAASEGRSTRRPRRSPMQSFPSSGSLA
jgi:hypothetical protein